MEDGGGGGGDQEGKGGKGKDGDGKMEVSTWKREDMQVDCNNSLQ